MISEEVRGEYGIVTCVYSEVCVCNLYHSERELRDFFFFFFFFQSNTPPAESVVPSYHITERNLSKVLPQFTTEPLKGCGEEKKTDLRKKCFYILL